MTEAEKELVFSKTLAGTYQGRRVRDIIQEFFESQKH